MSHVHAFFMHTYLSFLSFWYWSCWYSSACLSLFLSVSLHMAPKHKSTPSRNPLRFGVASSSNPTPSSVWFCDDKAHQDFLENFSRCGIHSEHQVILSDFFNTDLPNVIYNRGWESLFDILVTCPSVIIQKFYSNMHRFDYSVPHFITRVQCTCIVVTPYLIFKDYTFRE